LLNVGVPAARSATALICVHAVPLVGSAANSDKESQMPSVGATGVNVGDPLTGVLVGATGVMVGVSATVFVAVSVADSFGRSVGVAVAVSVGTGVGISVAVAVAVDVKVGVRVGVAVGGLTTVKFLELVAVPAALFTLIGPTPAFGGATALILELDLTVKLLAGMPLNKTWVILTKLLPFTVTTVPAGPDEGEKEEIDGLRTLAAAITVLPLALIIGK